MTARLAALGLSLGLGLASILVASDARSEAPAAPHLTLSAEGETHAAPDRAVITLGVGARADTAADAMRQDAARMSAVMAALRAAGLADRDIQTSDLSLNPEYARGLSSPGGGDQPLKLTGYAADNQIAVTVRDLARLGSVLDAAVAAGADHVDGISFGLNAPKAAEDTARRAAVAALRDKAELYAAAAGLHLGRLMALSEGGGYQPGPVRPMMMRANLGAAPIPIAAGDLDVRIEVNGDYELLP